MFAIFATCYLSVGSVDIEGDENEPMPRIQKALLSPASPLPGEKREVPSTTKRD